MVINHLLTGMIPQVLIEWSSFTRDWVNFNISRAKIEGILMHFGGTPMQNHHLTVDVVRHNSPRPAIAYN